MLNRYSGPVLCFVSFEGLDCFFMRYEPRARVILPFKIAARHDPEYVRADPCSREVSGNDHHPARGAIAERIVAIGRNIGCGDFAGPSK